MATQTNTPDLWKDHLTPERREQNKYSRGHTLVIAGPEMLGASKLAAMAARRMGAGIVTVMGPEAQRGFVLEGSPGLLFAPLKTASELKAFCQERKVASIVVGQGLGRDDKARKTVLAALDCKLPTVIDADGLTSFAQTPAEILQALHDKCVLTPHEAEFLKFFNTITGHSKAAATQLAAHKSGAVVVHKGAETIIATGTEAIRNEEASPLLATAGSGDILAGVIGALLARRVPTLYAACAGVWAHSKAGQAGGFGLIAEDLPLLCAQAFAPHVTINKKEK